MYVHAKRSIAFACRLIWVVQRHIPAACCLKSASRATQVTQLLDGMTPGAVRLDVRTSDFRPPQGGLGGQARRAGATHVLRAGQTSA